MIESLVQFLLMLTGLYTVSRWTMQYIFRLYQRWEEWSRQQAVPSVERIP